MAVPEVPAALEDSVVLMKVLVATEALTAAATAVLVVLTAVLAAPVALTEAPAVSKALTDYNSRYAMMLYGLIMKGFS